MKAIVVEDSRLAREGLIKMLEKFSSIELLGSAENVSQARALIQKYNPEVIFLDIHMPGENAFDLLNPLEQEPKIIFTTAYAEYAVRSFDFNTIDYLLKPISQERLGRAVDKLISHANTDSQYKPDDAKLDYNTKILVRNDERSQLLNLNDIFYFESCKNYVRIFCSMGKYFVKKSLLQIEGRLPEQHFVKISRQCIVNLDHILAMDDSINDGFDITMTDGQILNVSRRNATALKSMLSI
ncbi:MAG: two-component system LytT family response regulator [Flavobacteriales bacterium]|jgi:two-component system LytT family response regulator